MWLPGGVCGCWGGVHGCWVACMVVGGHVWLPGVCVVAGGHAWLWGVHDCGGCAWLQGVCMVAGGGACIGYDEVRSMSGRYASYWNAFFLIFGIKHLSSK